MIHGAQSARRIFRSLQFGLDVQFALASLDFEYGQGVFGPKPEARSLDAIRKSLRDPTCQGPDPVYNIAMDVGRIEHRTRLNEKMLLFGVVAYANGQLGDEPVRSQGHVHAVSPHSGWSAPELFEIWHGSAIIYGQEKSGDDPGRCIAVRAEKGDTVVMPPRWAHCVINANPESKMIFAAWCDRQYGFEYDQVRSHGGLAWFPVLSDGSSLTWEPNPRYSSSELKRRNARTYPELGLEPGIPIYELFAKNSESVGWVSEPSRFSSLWQEFEP